MGDADIERLIRGLEDFRTRSECIRGLVVSADDAVEPLIAAMDSAFSEGARWAIIKCLGAIGDGRAIPALAPLLKEKNMAVEAREALARIAGKDLGPDPAPWLKHAGRKERAGDAAGGVDGPLMRRTGLDEKQLMELIFARSGVPYEKTGDGRYAAEIPAGQGESQPVRIHFGEKDHEGEPIVIVYSRCGSAESRHYEHALRRNLKMPYGALAISGAGANARFVMFNTLLRQDMSAAELKKSVFTVAERAGQVKRELAERGKEQAGER